MTTSEYLEKGLSEQELNQRVSVLRIVEGTSVDGVGLRTSIYFAGCSHQCKGCHNPQSWDKANGIEMTFREILNVIEENGFNVTFSGGDPFFQVDEVAKLAKAIKLTLGKSIWCYTGYRLEEIQSNERLCQLLEYVDVLVDGRFELALRNTTLHFRGSSNQRIIYLNDDKRAEISNPNTINNDCNS